MPKGRFIGNLDIQEGTGDITGPDNKVWLRIRSEGAFFTLEEQDALVKVVMLLNGDTTIEDLESPNPRPET